MVRWIAAIGLLIAASPASAQYSDDELPKLFQRIAKEARLADLGALLSAWESGSTAPASEPSQEVLRRIEERLSRLAGASVERETFTARVSVDAGSSLQVPGHIAPILPIESNFGWDVRQRISGELLVFATARDARAFNGYDLEGKIVVLPFSTGSLWLRAAELGAVAAVFFMDGPSSRRQAEAKFVSVPLEFPRFWVEELPAKWKSGVEAVIEDRSSAETRELANLRFQLPGADPAVAHERILIATHWDQSCVAVGAAEARRHSANLRAWLGLAEHFARTEHRRPIEFALFDGHQFGLLGEREFVRRRLESDLRVYSLVVTLDLSSGSPRLGSFARGRFYETRPESVDPVRRTSAAFRALADGIAKTWGRASGKDLFVDGVNESDGRLWKSSVGAPLALGAEPFVLAGYPAITLATIDDARLDVDVPRSRWSRFEREDERRLAQQFRTIACLLEFVANNPAAEGVPGYPVAHLRPIQPKRSSLVAGFSCLDGKVAASDPAKSLLPSQFIGGAWVAVPGRAKTWCGVRGWVESPTDRNGRYRIDGLPAVTAYWHSDRPKTAVFAFAPDPASGRIGYAATRSTAATAVFERSFLLTLPFKSNPVVLFPCSSRPLFQLSDPLTLEALPAIRFLEPNAFSEPRDFDAMGHAPGDLRIGMAFLHLNGSFAAICGRSGNEVRILELPGAKGRLAATRRAASLLDRARRRSAELEKYRILPKGLAVLQAAAERHAARAVELEGRRQWTASQAEAEIALAQGLRAYPPIAGAAQDVLYGVLFYLALLVPFSLAVERIVMPQKALARRIAVSLLLFATGYVGLRFLHPAFELIASPFIVFVGFVMAGLSLLVIAMVLGKFDERMRVGSDRFESSSVSASVAVPLALSSLRRRPLRTGLTVATLTIVATANLMFTSIVQSPAISETRVPSAEPGTAFFPGHRPMPAEVEPGDADRAYLWAYAGDPSSAGIFAIESASAVAEVRVLVGSLPLQEEPAAVLPKEVANSLEVREGDIVRILGSSFRARISSESSAEPMPIDFPGSGLSQPQADDAQIDRAYLRYSQGQVVHLEGFDLREFGGAIRGWRTSRPADEILQRRDLLVAPLDRSETVTRYAMVSQAGGYGLAGMALVLALLFVFQSMLASAHERRSEISVLSSLGMPPRMIARLFLAEAAALGTLGTVLGYFAAQGASLLARQFPAFHALEMNVSSTNSMLSSVLVIGACLFAAAYPAAMAASVAAPAHADEMLSHRPEGDDWRCELPISVAEEEAADLLAHLESWLKGFEQHSVGEIVTENVVSGGREVACRMWLAPFDLGVRQQIIIGAAAAPMEGVALTHLTIRREHGDRASWERANLRFFALIRQELLRWRLHDRAQAMPPS